MSKIVSALRNLGEDMKFVGELMQRKDVEEMQQHGSELWRAGCMALCWADDIEGENV